VRFPAFLIDLLFYLIDLVNFIRLDVLFSAAAVAYASFS
jgi:hypothetical protein